MELFISLSSTKYYRGCNPRFAKFSEYRPIFFSKSREYASAYGPKMLEVELKINRFFDTRVDARAVEIYNEHFLRSGLARSGAKPIKLGTPVQANDADELWSYLSVPDYPAPHYDGIVVFEGSLGNWFNEADLSYVPLHIDQIKIVNA